MSKRLTSSAREEAEADEEAGEEERGLRRRNKMQRRRLKLRLFWARPCAISKWIRSYGTPKICLIL